MKKQSKILLLVVAGVVCFVVFAQFFLKKTPLTVAPGSDIRSVNETGLNPTSPSAIKTEKVKIVFGNFNEVSGNVMAANAFEALKKLTADKNINLVTKEYKFGMMVAKIGDLENSGDKYWLYKVNGKMAEVAADRYVIYPGDEIEWAYGDGK